MRLSRCRDRATWVLPATAAVVLLAWASAASAGAPPTTVAPPTTGLPSTTIPTLPVVSITAATDSWWFVEPSGPCSEALTVDEQRATVLISAAGAFSPGLVVGYRLTPPGLLSPGPGWPEGPTSIEMVANPMTHELVPKLATEGSVVLELLPGPGYEVGTPSRVTVLVDDRSEDPGCGPPTFTSASSNASQQLLIGDQVGPLDVVPFGGAAATFEIDHGTLPPGVELQADGTFTGTATAAGTYVVEIGACTPYIAPMVEPAATSEARVGPLASTELRCAHTRLTIVVGAGQVSIPVTG